MHVHHVSPVQILITNPHFSHTHNPKIKTQIPKSSKKKNMSMSRSMNLKLWVVFALVFSAAGAVMGMRKEEEEEYGYGEESDESMFLMHDSKHVIRTDAGEMRVMKSPTSEGFGAKRGGFVDRMRIGFLVMEPKTLFVPQYVDSSLILFLRRGEAKIGWIYKDAFVEKQLKMGDVYRIPAGSVFYLVNTGEGQRLHLVCSIDNSERMRHGAFQSFFIAGGTYPTSVLAGFDTRTLATAFNVSKSDLEAILSTQSEGPIVYIPDSGRPSIWANFLKLKEDDRLQHMKKMADFEDDSDDEEQEQTTRQHPTWSFRKMLNIVFGEENAWRGGRGAPDSYNLYDRRPDYKNNYGWSVALDKHDYSPLKHSGIGIYLVNLTAGAMMAPHINPTATEYGVVLKGTGSIQVVFPNGTLAMKAQVKEGDVFWVPRYFPFCQIASRSGPLEFFGFTTSARRNRPQFLVGASSVLHTMRGPEMAAAFGVSLEEYDRLIGAQNEAVILPSTYASPPEKAPKVLRSFE